MSATDGTCSDCGRDPIHQDIAEYLPYCRGCAERNGHAWRFLAKIDRDRLRLMLADFGKQFGAHIFDRVVGECCARE